MKRKLNPDEHRLLFVILGLCVLFYLAYIGHVNRNEENTKLIYKKELTLSAAQLFTEKNLSAKAAYVYDATDGVPIFSMNENQILPLASLAKVMTAIVAGRDIPQTEKIYISKNAVSVSGDNGLIVGDNWMVRDIIAFMLLSSSNDAATAIREHIDTKFGAGSFISRMNEYAREIGLTQTTFYNESGLDKDVTPGAIGTASDVAQLFLTALRDIPEIMLMTTKSNLTFSSSGGSSLSIENTNNISNYVDDLLASKTGYTKLAGGNLGIVFRVPVYGHDVVAVVLGSTGEDRFTDMKFLINTTTEYFKKVQQ